MVFLFSQVSVLGSDPPKKTPPKKNLGFGFTQVYVPRDIRCRLPGPQILRSGVEDGVAGMTHFSTLIEFRPISPMEISSFSISIHTWLVFFPRADHKFAWGGHWALHANVVGGQLNVSRAVGWFLFLDSIHHLFKSTLFSNVWNI